MDLLGDIRSHLAAVAADPAGNALDPRLLEKFDRQVTESISETDRDILVHQLAELLPTLQQDPTPATTLVEILIRPASYTFDRVLDIDPHVDFAAGLKALFPSINLVTLSLLEKATFKSSDAGIIAGKPEIVAALVELWLSTPNTAVASKAHDVLLGLLVAGQRPREAATTTSQDYPEHYHEPSLMWRRVFRDKDIYDSIFRVCSLVGAGQNGQLGKRDKTVAQARLLDLLVKIDCESIRRPQIAEVESRYGVKDGLMEFAALKMVDYKDDVLMHMTLIDFFADLLKPGHSMIQTREIASYQLSSSSHKDLDLRGTHNRILSYYLDATQQSSLDSTYLYGRSANYLATYCSYHPAHFLSSQPVVDSTVARLLEVLRKMTPGQWAQGSTPKHDLHVLASVPRQALLPTPTSASSLFLLSARPANKDVLQTLATVFQGPKDNHSTENHLHPDAEAQQRSAARALYWLYLDQYPTLWQDVVKAAETVALKNAALAAIALINAIVNASWSPLPSQRDAHLLQGPYALPTEQQLRTKCHASQDLPPSGLLAILSPPALETILPYLLRPAQTFSNLVGGGKGDVESAAYRVAAAKYDVLRSLKSRLQEYVEETGQLQEVVAVVDKRLAMGPMGGGAEVGGRVGTLEL